jgi:hypothetical protein
MDIRKVKKLIEMLEESNLEEIEIQEGEESVRLVKNKANNLVSNHPSHSSPAQTVEVAGWDLLCLCIAWFETIHFSWRSCERR